MSDDAESIIRTWVEYFRTNEDRLAEQILHPDVVFRSPFAWEEPVRGIEQYKEYNAAAQEGFDEIDPTIEEFAATEAGGYARISFEFEHVGQLRDEEPTGTTGRSVETHVFEIEDGKIVRHDESFNTLDVPRLLDEV